MLPTNHTITTAIVPLCHLLSIEPAPSRQLFQIVCGRLATISRQFPRASGLDPRGTHVYALSLKPLSRSISLCSASA
jgi:hypothetical protein